MNFYILYIKNLLFKKFNFCILKYYVFFQEEEVIEVEQVQQEPDGIEVIEEKADKKRSARRKRKV